MPPGVIDGAMPSVPAGFSIEVIARVPHARELVVTRNGDLLVGSLGRDVFVVPDAQDRPLAASVFAHLDDVEAAGLALAPGALVVGTTHGVWKIPYQPGDRVARGDAQRLFSVRTGGDGGHSTTSVAVTGDTLYASVGSSCNACDESDPTRATIVTASLAGAGLRPVAVHIRNAIALAVDPATGHFWAGVAGQDELAPGHPYEIFDDVGDRSGVPNYGWPACYEDRRAARPGADCANQTVPRAVFPAYETPIGATFSPAEAGGHFAFPPAWRGGAFVALHGSWHQPPVEPRVVFVPIHGDEPATDVDWRDPTAQWKTFAGGWQHDDGSRIGRPTGVALGTDGTLFIADDLTGRIFRIRPSPPRSQ
jgi:glucose/arabinose dehydrogenase